MKFPVIAAVGATFAYLARHALDLLKAMWLPAALLVALNFYAMGPMLTEVAAALKLGPNPNPSEAAAVLSGVGKWLLILMAGSAIAYPMLTSASLIHIVRGETLRGPVFARYGRDELLLLAAYIILAVMVALIGLVGDLIVSVLATMLRLAGPDAGKAAGDIGGLIVNVVTIWFQLRLSVLYAASLATRTTGFGAAWSTTKGAVLPLLGFWILVGVVYVPVALILMSPLVAQLFPLIARFSEVGADPVAAQEAAAAVVSAAASYFSLEHPAAVVRVLLLFAATLVLPAIGSVAAGTAWRYLTNAAGKT